MNIKSETHVSGLDTAAWSSRPSFSCT